jgi:GGDEF domain-containing protein
VILITDPINSESAELNTERVLGAIAKTVATSAVVLSLSCDIGVCLCPDHGRSLSSLMKAADQPMYGVKQLGRKGVAMTEYPEA